MSSSILGPQKNRQANLLEHLFEEWNVAQIQYVVLRNYERLPEHTGNDIDILLDARQLKRAQQLLRKAGQDTGWTVHNVVDFACRTVNLFHHETLEQVHIDLMHAINWHAIPYLSHADILRNRRQVGTFYAPAQVDEAVVNLMTRLIYGGYVKEAYRHGCRAAAVENSSAFARTLTPWIGAKLARRLVAFSAQDRWGEIEALAKSVRARVLTANLRHPLRLVGLFIRDGLRLGRRWTRSPGVSVVFVGPDGSGKTSVGDRLKAKLAKTFYPQRGLYCHWKPVRGDKGSLAPTVDPHGRPARSSVLSVAFSGYHLLAFVFGWWIHVKPVLFKNGLVIIDRFYYDFFVDQKRYRLNLPQWVVRLGFVLVKKPDLVFCLDTSSEVLQARKHEVPLAETVRQREAYRKLVSSLANGHVINAHQPLEAVVGDVQRIVLVYMAERTTRAVRFG